MPILERIPHLHAATAWESNIPLESRYTAGVAGQAWFTALKTKGVLYGAPCAHCHYTYVPARLFCERCFAKLEESDWVPVGPAGTLESFTVLHLAPDGAPLETPRTLALVRFDGADSVFIHDLAVPAGAKPAIGQRVTAVLKPVAERTASIHDILHFALS